MSWLKRGIAACLMLSLVILILILGIGWFVAPDDELKKSDAIIVVSGGDTVKRTEEGVQLWKAGWAPRIVFSGAAADRGTSNATVMQRQAIRSGVPEAVTFVEGQSVNTKENAERTKPILQANNMHSAILVSSPYHTRRVKTTFKKGYGEGYTFLSHPAKDTLWARSSWWKQPETIELTFDELRKTFYVAFFQ